MRRLFLIVLFFSLPLVVQAKVDAYPFDDPAQEARYKKLIDELRCLVCQNQNLADSNAELAQDMRAGERALVGTQQHHGEYVGGFDRGDLFDTPADLEGHARDFTALFLRIFPQHAL